MAEVGGRGVLVRELVVYIDEGELSLVLVRTPLKTTARNLAKSENFLM